MAVIPMGETNPDGGGGKYLDKAGLFQFYVNDIQPADDHIGVKSTVLAGTELGEISKEHNERLSFDAKFYWRILEFACATGVLTKEQWRQMKESNTGFDTDLLANAIGMSFCAESKRTPGKGDKADKTYTNLTGGFHAPGDPAANHYPLDPEYVASMTNGLPTKDGTLRKRGAAPGPVMKPDDKPSPAGQQKAANGQPAGTNQGAPTSAKSRFV